MALCGDRDRIDWALPRQDIRQGLAALPPLQRGRQTAGRLAWMDDTRAEARCWRRWDNQRPAVRPGVAGGDQPPGNAPYSKLRQLSGAARP